MITAPSRESRVHCSRAMVERGVSRMQRISLKRSFSATCAVRVISVSPIPEAILPSVEVEQGIMTNTSNRFEPDARGAARSSFANCRLTYGCSSFSEMFSSSFRSAFPHLLTTRNLSGGKALLKDELNISEKELQ